VRNESNPHGSVRYARAAELARRQWGAITTRQLLGLRFSRREIHLLTARGLLHALHRGVFAFGALSPAPEQRWAAALLAAGERAALGHTSAAGFHGQLPVRAVTEVTAPTRRRGDGTLTVRTAKRHESTVIRGVRVATPAQTLLDLASIGWPIDRMAHDMAASGLVSLDALRAFAGRRRGEPGARALAKALAMPHTRSGWEREFLAWVRALGVALPIPNDRIGALTVDCHWPGHGLVIELDTEQTHGSAWAQRDDARRDARLTSKGKEVWRVRREDWRPAVLAVELRRRLS
jgi:hypothetical protein